MADSQVSRDAIALLESRCVQCHAYVAPVSGNSLIANGWIVPGSSASSTMNQRVASGQMPPVGPLSSAEVQLLANWVDTQFQPAPGASPGASPLPTGPLTATQILSRRCASCHGASSPGDGGINYIEDVQRLVNGGWIVPGSPDTSSLFIQVNTGQMPTSGPLAAAEIDTLRSWIQNDLGAYSIPATATYRSVQANVIGPYCVRCHGSSVARGGIRLETYTQVMRHVSAGSPNQSKLYTIMLEGEMPPRGEPVQSSAQLQLVSEWIRTGAANN